MIIKSKNIIAIIVTIIIALSSFNLINTAMPQTLYAQTYEEELEQIQKEREEAKKKIEETSNNRVTAIYKNGNGNVLEVILNAEDFIDFISKLKLMNLFAEQDTQNILLIKEKRDETIGIKKSIIDLRERQKDYKSRVEKLVTQAEQKTNEIQDLYGQKKNLLSQTTANKNALIRMEKELEIKEEKVK